MNVISHLEPAGYCDDAAEYPVLLSFEGNSSYEVVEYLWCRPLSDASFELCCIPFAAYNLALGDQIILELVESRFYTVTGVGVRSENATYRIWIADDRADLNDFGQELRGLGLLVE